MDAIHLIDAQRADWATLAALAECVRDGRVGSRVLALGDSDAVRVLRDSGSPVWRAIAPPLRRPRLALRRIGGAIEGAGSLVAWGEGAAALAERLRTPPRSVCYVARPDGRAPLRVVTADAAPPLLPGPSAAVRGAVRGAWAVGEGEPVVALLHDDPRRASAWTALVACAIVALAGRRVTLAVPAGAEQVLRAVELEDQLGSGVRIIVEDEPLHRWLPAADAGLFAPASGAPAAVSAWAACARCGIPRIAPREAGLPALLPTDCVAPGNTGRALSVALLRALDAGARPVPAEGSARVAEAVAGALRG